ncbi:hypothetical protein BgiMline_032542, partial [Biomphalaria glabrata]
MRSIPEEHSFSEPMDGEMSACVCVFPAAEPVCRVQVASLTQAPPHPVTHVHQHSSARRREHITVCGVCTK